MLVRELKYETKIKGFEDINPESVKFMLNEIRQEISSIDPSFKEKSLTNILAVVEKGEYRSDSLMGFKINLNSARTIIETYRKYSEGGCPSCISLGRETIDAQDASSGWYCKTDDPDYAKKAGGGVGVRYEGFSPKVKKHFLNPCDDWKPRFVVKLEELLKE